MADNIIAFPFHRVNSPSNDNFVPHDDLPPDGLHRNPELLIALCILRHLPAAVRKKVRKEVSLAAKTLHDDESCQAAEYLVSRLA